MNKVLVLGAGLVAKPLVDYLAKLNDTSLTVADIVQEKAEALTAEHGNAEALGFDASDEPGLADLVRNHDIAVSLLPGAEHPRVARLCLDMGKHMATASYVSPEMRAMDSDVAAKPCVAKRYSAASRMRRRTSGSPEGPGRFRDRLLRLPVLSAIAVSRSAVSVCLFPRAALPGSCRESLLIIHLIKFGFKSKLLAVVRANGNASRLRQSASTTMEPAVPILVSQTCGALSREISVGWFVF